MQTLRIGSVDVQSADPGVVKTLAHLKALGVDISNPSAISIAADGLFRKANDAMMKGDKELAEDLAHEGARAMVAALTLKKVQPQALKEPKSLLIDAGATKLQAPKDAPAAIVDIPPPAQLALPPGPGAGSGTTSVAPDAKGGVTPDNTVLTPADVNVGISTGTIIGVGAAAVLGWLAWKKFAR